MFKVVYNTGDELKSAVKIYDDRFPELTYKPGKWLRISGSRIFTFRTMSEAYNFTGMMKPYEIWLCEVENPEDFYAPIGEYSYFWKRFNKGERESLLPLCRKFPVVLVTGIKLIERVG